MQIIWMMVLEFSGRFTQQASITLKSWKFLDFKNKIDKKLMNKFRKSFPPLKIGKDRVFVIKRLNVLKFMRSIVTGVFRASVLGKR